MLLVRIEDGESTSISQASKANTRDEEKNVKGKLDSCLLLNCPKEDGERFLSL
jgi:hypothetical protein